MVEPEKLSVPTSATFVKSVAISVIEFVKLDEGSIKSSVAVESSSVKDSIVKASVPATVVPPLSDSPPSS